MEHEMFELTEQRKELQLRARAFAEAELPQRAAEVDESQSYPWDIVEKLTKAGFAGMTVPETAEALGISPRSVHRSWTAARAWLHREISRGHSS